MRLQALNQKMKQPQCAICGARRQLRGAEEAPIERTAISLKLPPRTRPLSAMNHV